jgi:hypothetical protein
MPHLERKIRVKMPVVSIPPFVFLVELDVDLFVEPRRGLYTSVRFFIPLKALVLPFSFVAGGLLIKGLDQLNDLFRLIFKSLYIKIDLGSDLVLGDAVFFGRVGISIMGGTSMAAGNDDPFARCFLKVVEEFKEDGIDPLFPMDQGKAMPVTVQERTRFT